MDIHNIDDYLDLQDQHQLNLLSTEEITTQPEGETEWHSASVVDNNDNTLGLDNPFLYNGDSTDWGLLQNQLDLHQGINFIGHGGILVSNNNNSNNCITPDSLFKQPEINIEQPLTPVEKEEEKRVTRSKAQGRVNNNTTVSPKKKKSRSKKLYCICQQPYNGKPMVQCDYCSEWYHCACVGFDADQEDEKEDSIDWACKKCIEDQKVDKKLSTTESETTLSSNIESPTSTTNTETPKITITVPARQTRSTRTQSRCLYAGCTNRTRADSYCSDVCARKDKETSTVQVKDEEIEQPSKANTRKSRMKTSALSTGTSTIDNELTRSTRSTRRKSTSSPENKKKKEEEEEYVKEDDDDEEEAEPSEEEDEKEEESTATTPDTPMSPSQMTEQENPVRRNVIKNISAILKTIIDKALAENNNLFEQEDDDMDPITRAETLAKSIENTMLEQLGDGTGKKQRTCGERYKSKFRSLLYNLKDKQNQVFQMRVITSDLSPLELVKMSSEDMANPELKSMSEVLRKTGLKNSVMKLDNTPIIKKTHKGDIIMVPSKDNDTHQNIYAEQMEGLSSSNDNNAKINEPLSSPVTTTEERKDSSSTLSPTPTDGSKVDPLDDILARIGIPAQDDHNSNKRGSLDTSGAEYTKKRKVTLDMEELLGDEDEEFRVEEVDTSELVQDDVDKIKEEEDKNEDIKAKEESSKEIEDSLPNIWHGRINMPQVAEFEASARQIGGRILNEAEWTEVLSPTMWIEGRIPSERVTSYVTQNQYSTSREIVLLEIEPADGMTNPSQSQTLLKYLDSRKRYAVVGHNKKIVKDFYLIPLYKTQDIPDCLYVVRVKERERKCDLFLGVLVITKQSPAKQTPPIAHTTTVTDAGTTSSISNLPAAAAAAAITSQYNTAPLPNYGINNAGYPVPSYNTQPQQPQYGYGYAASQSYNNNSNTNQYNKPMYQQQQQQQQNHQPPRYTPYHHQQQQGQGYRSRNGNHNNNNKNSSYGSSHYRPSY